MEALPSRRLLSVALSGEQLFVTGSSAVDHVLITVDAVGDKEIRVNLNGEWHNFKRNDLTGIQVLGLAGRDHIIVDEVNGGINIPMTLMGNGGNDLIIGGSGDDDIYGGGGQDRLIGGGGNDHIVGGGSRDQIAGGDGADLLIGNGGDDAVFGGAGNDTVLGGYGDDYADAGAGDDFVSGGEDYDSIIGGNGDDDLTGNRGDDDLDGGIGADTITGGAGDDASAQNDDVGDTFIDRTDGSDRVYTRVGMEFIPQQYIDLFNATFPNSIPLGIRINDDQTFVMLYRYNGDGTTYRAYFTFTGDSPFDNFDGIELVSYEVAPQNLPPLTKAAFQETHGSAVVKEVFADRDEQGGKTAVIRYLAGNGQTRVTTITWLDNDEPT
jgi:hypothetical protein